MNSPDMHIYLVGGAVRDQLLGYPFHEKDWVVVGARPEELTARGFQPVGKDFPVFLHPDSKEEYALARTERKSGRGYTGFACHTSPDVTLEEDLQRRDLTINAMAQDNNGTIIDPYGGQTDLQNKLLRHVSPAFIEDPLRVLRVARFAARYAHLGFHVAPETIELMQAISNSGELETLPAERVWKELERALGERSPQSFFHVLEDCQALKHLMPELLAVSDRGWQALQQTSGSERYDNPIRFTLLAFELDKSDTVKLCERIKAPNQYRDLALLANSLSTTLGQTSFNAEQKLQILEAADAFRKPERLVQLLTAAELYYQRMDLLEPLTQAFQLSLKVDPRSIVASGLKGPAIAEELRQQRIECIAKQLTSKTSTKGSLHE